MCVCVCVWFVNEEFVYNILNKPELDDFKYYYLTLIILAKSAGAVEYNNCISAEGYDHP